MDNVRIGTSGWSYPHWKTCFYRGIPHKDWLAHYARHFNSVEINGTFYRLQKPATLEKWFAETPAEFRFSIKANRYLTHRKKLLDPLQSVMIEREHAQVLRNKLASVLWQLPQTFSKDANRLENFMLALQQWPEIRHAIEFRHPSWFNEETAQKLNSANIAACLSDAGNWPIWERITADLVYVRLHGNPITYVSSYSLEELALWADRIVQWLQQDKLVHLYFDNDAQCAAPANAEELQHLLNRFVSGKNGG